MSRSYVRHIKTRDGYKQSLPIVSNGMVPPAPFPKKRRALSFDKFDNGIALRTTLSGKVTYYESAAQYTH